MGRAGPKGQPVEKLKLVGSSEVSRRKKEPGIVAGDPEPPDWLSESAMKQWGRMVERMRGMQFLSPMWRESLAQFCEAWAEYESLILECQGQPMVVYGKNDAPYLNPLFAAKAKAWDRVLKMGREFGYTPASKADVKVESKPQDTSKKRFFKGA